MGNADFDRQVDVYKLARMGESRCKSLWADLVKSEPNTASLVVTYVEKEKQTRDNAKNIVDGVLIKAKKAKKKKNKLSRAEKNIVKAQKPWFTKASDPNSVKAHNRAVLESAFVRSMADSHDPLLREMARKQLGMLWAGNTARSHAENSTINAASSAGQNKETIRAGINMMAFTRMMSWTVFLNVSRE